MKEMNKKLIEQIKSKEDFREIAILGINKFGKRDENTTGMSKNGKNEILYRYYGIMNDRFYQADDFKVELKFYKFNPDKRKAKNNSTVSEEDILS